MLALGQGAQQEIEIQIQAAGTNMITVRAGSSRRGGIGMGMGQSPRLKAEDVDAIRERVPDAQFLVEAILLSLIGGLLRVGLRVSLSEGLTQFLAWPTSVPADAVVVAVGFAAATGIFFGFYPARKAARLDPIGSLRFE